jgi:hypothetical protein
VRKDLLNAISLRVYQMWYRRHRGMIPDLVGNSAKEKQMRVVFNKTAGSAVAVNVGGKATDSISRRKSLSEKPPSKGFEKRGHGFDFPDFLKDGVGVG